ncbi:DUF1761 domain-containing protein [Parvularcula flava]|uniref:DUF1761 domain-containing protein n=1 Tax=Aquisalinus luteolus TaxID=1566827 RepID=A0A8J3A0I5_9PROT|nr:DUF1761 domain-containing protein [Aquisalinus luteolus]NHK26779.1 DUF1761 domain-containing protein [Aquisalinus luteolus]GGH93388.1 hypothetical protein GCM10011355_05110 [Aquisalinus luteolus]
MRIFGLPLIPVIVAGVIFNVISFGWYAYFFGDEWIVSHGFAEAAAHSGSPLWRMVSPLLAFAQVIGLGLVLQWRGWPDIGGTIATALIVALLFAVPVLAYDPVNLPSHNVIAFVIDAGHLILAWIASALVLTAMRRD